MTDVLKFINSMKRTNENLVQSSEELDKAIDHIVKLLDDACNLYFNESYSSSAFLSITSCEETAKAHIGNFTDGNTHEKKGRNMFMDHKTKHKMAALPTVAMGKRLEDALGKNELLRVMSMAQNGGFIQIRENALYFKRENSNLVIPSEKIDKNLSRCLFLFAVEIFDDALVGLTNYSFKMGELTDKLFEKVSKT